MTILWIFIESDGRWASKMIPKWQIEMINWHSTEKKYHCKSLKRARVDGAHDADDDDVVEHEPQIVCSNLRIDATLHRHQHKHYSFHNCLTCGRQFYKIEKERKIKINFPNQWNASNHSMNTAREKLEGKRKLFIRRVSTLSGELWIRVRDYFSRRFPFCNAVVFTVEWEMVSPILQFTAHGWLMMPLDIYILCIVWWCGTQ